MAKFDLTKIDAAVDQLDWAIRLFIDYSAFAAAITLAGAAEEILGRAVASRSAFEQLRTKFSKDFSLAEKAVSQGHLNRAKNWLKHWDGRADDEKITLELDEEASIYPPSTSEPSRSRWLIAK